MSRRVDLSRWLPHVEEARRRGQTLKAYAAQEGVSLSSMYRASQALREVPAPENGAPVSAKAFVPVRVRPSRPASVLRVAAQLPNGVSLQVEVGASDLTAVVASLGALRCCA